jgi:hypothetical protein
MIIINLKAGLGNQMFQYACGRALALRNDDSLKLDISSFVKQDTSRYSKREYSLAHFCIHAEIAGMDEIERIKYPLGLISRVSRTCSTLFKQKILRQFNIRFDQKVANLKGNSYLDGFWQSEKYFKDFEEDIGKDFTLKSIGNEAKIILEEIVSSTMPIAIQIRRGDNVTNPHSARHHGCPGMDYYSRAIRTIEEKLPVDNIRFFVFSDDIEWVKENLSSLSCTFVSKKGIRDYEEIELMRACKHHIISNSTLGWWGAWLNPNPNKIVIVPKQWVKKAQWQHKDTVPKSWIRI